MFHSKLRWAVKVSSSGERVLVLPGNLRVDARQPEHVPAAAAWLRENTPPGRKYSPKPPPVQMPGMPPRLTPEQEADAARAAATEMDAYRRKRESGTT